MYLCIDLKSFYASVECVLRNLDPLTTNLVVADPKRGKGAICLAITPSMKKLGIKNRCRIFEIPKNVKYIVALPRMKKYIEYSSLIYSIYLKYISKDDIFPYSVDECFIDVSYYELLYKKDPVSIAKMLIDDVYKTTNITATVGIGDNLFLAKVALDIISKTSKDNIGYLTKKIYDETLLEHQPLTDFWQIGEGIKNRLETMGIRTMKDIRDYKKELLYKEFGTNAEYLIDHANGIEPCTILDIKNYKSKNKSISTGQILVEEYTYEKTITILKEMVEVLVLDLVDKSLVTNNISLYVFYEDKSKKSVNRKIDIYTNSLKKILENFILLYEKNISKDKYIKKINISFNNLKSDDYETVDLFSNIDDDLKENELLSTVNNIKKKYGKNSIIRGIDLLDESTIIERNNLIGGHNAE